MKIQQKAWAAMLTALWNCKRWSIFTLFFSSIPSKINVELYLRKIEVIEVELNSKRI